MSLRYQIDRSAIVSVAADSEATIVSYIIPASSNFLLTHVGCWVRDLGPLGLISWKVKRNSIAVYPYEDIQGLLGREGEPFPAEGENLRFHGADLVEIIGINKDAAISLEIGATIRGRVSGG